MMNLSRRIALVAMMLILAIGGAWAQPGGGGRGNGNGNGQPPGGDRFERGPGIERSFDRCLESLELTREQRAAIAAIKQRLANAVESTRATIAGLKERLHEARESGDREAVAAIMEQMHAAELSLRTMHEGAHQAIIDQLTDAQKAALRDCMNVRNDRGRHDQGRMDCFSQLDLSDEQMAQIAAMRERFRNAHHAQMTEIRELHRRLREARRDGDTTAMARIRAAIAQKMESLRNAQQALKEALLGILTPEQLAELEDCQDDREDNGRGRGGVIEDNRMVPQLD